MKRRHFLLVVFLLLLLGGICACKSSEAEKTVILSADYPQYDSVGELADRADLIIRGSVKAMQYRQIDISLKNDANDPDAPGEDESMFPYTVYTVSIEETLKGEIPVGDSIEVKVPGGVFDGICYQMEGVNAPILETEQSYLLFLATYENLPASLLNVTQAAYELAEDGEIAREDAIRIQNNESEYLDFNLQDLKKYLEKPGDR